jgi:hypothetical protein
MSERISIREYARRLNINEKAVRKALAAGLIVGGYDKDVKKIIPDQANAEWGYKHEVVRAGPGLSKVKAAKKRESASSLSTRLESAEAIEPVSPPPVGVMVIDNAEKLDLLKSIVIRSDMTVGDAAKYREILAAAHDKIKLAEAEGRLVAKDRVEKALYALGSELKKALLNVPVRVVRDIMAAENEVQGINLLTDEITAVLATYGNLTNDAL